MSAAVVAMMTASSCAGAAEARLTSFVFGCEPPAPQGKKLKPKLGDVDGVFYTNLPGQREQCLEVVKRKISLCRESSGAPGVARGARGVRRSCVLRSGRDHRYRDVREPDALRGRNSLGPRQWPRSAGGGGCRRTVRSRSRTASPPLAELRA